MKLIACLKNKKNPSRKKNSLCFRKWNFVTLRLKKFSYFLKRKHFLYFWKRNPALFSLCSIKKKKKKSFLYFFKRKFFSTKLIIQETKTTKEFLMFEEMKLFLYFKKGILRTQGYNRNFLFVCKWSFLALYFSYIWGRSNFPSSESKKDSLLKSLLYFWKWNFLIFKEGIVKFWKTNKRAFSR